MTKMKFNQIKLCSLRLGKGVQRLLFLTLLIASVGVIAKAQSSEMRSGLETLKTPKARGEAKSLASESAPILNQSIEPAATTVKGKVEGTWLFTGTLSDGPPGFPFKSLITFAPGRSDTEGSLIRTNNVDLIAPLSGTTAQGAWQKTGPRNFAATAQAFLFDATSGFLPAGMITIKDTLTLLNDDLLTLASHIEVFDFDGNLLFAFDATAQGTRLRP